MAAGTREYWEEVLEDHRDELTSVLKPDRYFDKFRSERILDESDTQEISNETLNPSRSKKAGHFLDILRTRGSMAYKLLLDCLEADHPELYKKMTGNDPTPKAWTISLQKRCSCECHDDRVTLDFISAYKDEKQTTITLKHQVDKQTKNLDKVKNELLKLKHENETINKQYEMCQSDREEIEKLKNEIRWQRDQICDLQGKAFSTQQDLMQSNSAFREAKLENSTLLNKLRETQAREKLQRKKSIRLQQEHTESTEKMKDGDALKHIVEQLTIELEKKKIEEARKLQTIVSTEEHKIYEETARDIMIADRDAALEKCEDAVKELYEVRKAYYDMYESKEKLEAVNEDLETRAIYMNEQLDTVKDRLQMAQEELEQVSEERSQAFRERNRSIEETVRSIVERDDLVRKLNNERTANVKLSRQIFEFKVKLRRLDRDAQVSIVEDRPSSVVSTDGSSGNDSKRSSAVQEPALSGDVSVANPDNYTTSQSNATPRKRPEPHHSTSLLSMKQHESFDEEDEDDLNDYELLRQVPRSRSRVLTREPSSVVRRKSDAAASLPANTSNDGGAGVDSVTLPVENGANQSHLPSAEEDSKKDPWGNFNYIEEEPSLNTSLSHVPRRLRRDQQSDSTDVQLGSLKDKNRTPGPRISSCDIPENPYTAHLNRRSKTLDY